MNLSLKSLSVRGQLNNRIKSPSLKHFQALSSSFKLFHPFMANHHERVKVRPCPPHRFTSLALYLRASTLEGTLNALMTSILGLHLIKNQ